MSDQARTIYIDRIRLTGLEITPERAERIRALIEARLQHLLEQENWPDGLTAGKISRLNAPTMRVSMPDSDNHVANGLAQSIAKSLRGVK